MTVLWVLHCFIGIATATPSCSGLPGYVEVGDTWLRLSNTKKTYADAKGDCEAQGTLPVMPRTEAVLLFIDDLSEDVWIGLENPDGINCNTFEGCSTKLYWADGNLATDLVDNPVDKILMNGGGCPRFRQLDQSFDDSLCTTTYVFICQLTCAASEFPL